MGKQIYSTFNLSYFRKVLSLSVESHIKRNLYYLLSLFLTLIISNCGSTIKLCEKEDETKCGCNPYYQRIDKLNIALDKSSSKTIKYFIDNLSVNGKALDKEYINVGLKGSIGSSKEIDPKVIDAVIRNFEKIPPPIQEYENWLKCVYPKGVPTKRGVILMDSHVEGVVYCERIQKIGGSNADNISLFVRELGCLPYTVATNLNWQDEERVIELARKIKKETNKPTLIIIHASAFYEKTMEPEANNKLLLFLDAIKNEDVRILVYTRGLPEDTNPGLLQRYENVLNKVEELKVKAKLHEMKKRHNSCFDDAEVASAFKKDIKTMLADEFE